MANGVAVVDYSIDRHGFQSNLPLFQVAYFRVSRFPLYAIRLVVTLVLVPISVSFHWVRWWFCVIYWEF